VMKLNSTKCRNTHLASEHQRREEEEEEEECGHRFSLPLSIGIACALDPDCWSSPFLEDEGCRASVSVV